MRTAGRELPQQLGHFPAHRRRRIVRRGALHALVPTLSGSPRASTRACAGASAGDTAIAGAGTDNALAVAAHGAPPAERKYV